MIIDSSYFVGEIYLKQVGYEASTVANNNSELQRFIDNYEPKILEKAFGYSMYDEFLDQLEYDGTLKVGVDQKWDDLLNGAEYTNNSVVYKWRGMKRVSGTLKKSFIAYYVYYWYVKSGENLKTSQQSEEPESNIKLVSAWRNFHEWYGGNDEGTAYFKGTVKGIWYEDYFLGAGNTKQVSLYQFLTDHQDVYTDWSFTHEENKNTWGI